MANPTATQNAPTTAQPTSQAKKPAQAKQAAPAAAPARETAPTAPEVPAAAENIAQANPTATQNGEVPAATVAPDATETDKPGDNQDDKNDAPAISRSAMVLTNCTDSPLGITFKRGVVILQGREMRSVPDAEQEEVRAMFKSRTFQRFVDNGILRLSEMSDDEESAVVKTPEPPAALNPVIQKDSLERSVSTATGSRAQAPTVVEHQPGGPLPEQASEAKA